MAWLQGDIALAAAQGGDARVARVADLAGRIKAAVSRGEEINRHLHGFAHSVDDPHVSFDLGRLLELLAFLESRAARLAGVELAVHGPQRDVALTGDPFALLLSLHGCVGSAITAAGSGNRVEVTAEPHVDGARIAVRCRDAWDPERAGASPALAAGASAWAAATAIETGPGGVPAIVITVPATRAGVPLSEGGSTPGEEP